MKTQYFEANKDCDLFRVVLKVTYWFTPRINSSMVLGLIESFYTFRHIIIPFKIKALRNGKRWSRINMYFKH